MKTLVMIILSIIGIVIIVAIILLLIFLAACKGAGIAEEKGDWGYKNSLNNVEIK